MDNAMNNNDRAEQIAAKVRDLEERLTEWRSLATQDRSDREIARLGQVVEGEITRVRSLLPYREHLDEVVKKLHSATDDGVLIQRLYEEIFLRSAV
jgi:hypothetical protein